jgi:TRAP-type C4-dicarboxylate transport system substrate-binding protein
MVPSADRIEGRKSMKLFRICVAAVLALAPLGAAADEVVLKSVSTWPSSYAVVKEYLRFVERVNETGKGVVRIDHVGGPEVVPADQQDMAIRNGVFDIQFGAASYYSGVVPEADALKASEISPVEARKSGAIDLLSGIWRKKLNAEVLAWMSGGIGFYLYLTEAPKLTDQGVPDLRGLKLRSSSAYKDWFEALGATNVMMAPPETFSAFERGMVDGLAATGINFRDVGVTNFIKVRVSPAVWQIDTLIVMNAGKFDALPEEARKVLVAAAVAQEAQTMDAYRAQADEEAAEIAKSGVQFIDLGPDAGAKYKALAHELVWERLARNAPGNADALRRAFSR